MWSYMEKVFVPNQGLEQNLPSQLPEGSNPADISIWVLQPPELYSHKFLSFKKKKKKVSQYASDIPQLYTDQTSSHIKAIGKRTMFILWVWIPLGSRHQSLRSMIAKIQVSLWKWSANRFRIGQRSSSEGDSPMKKGFFAFPPIVSDYPHCSCWNSSINIMAGLPFLRFSLAYLRQNGTVNKNFSKNL